MTHPSAPPELQYVPLAQEHLDRIMAIEVEAYPEPWTRGMFVDELRNPRSHFDVVFLDEALVGYGGFWLVLDEAHITSVTVCRDQRGRGYGRRLMEHLLERARTVGARLATLEVRMSNLTARNLYLSLGFRPVGIRKDYYPRSHEDAMVMLAELT
ncbi:MAG: ribosomal protein S18-alanine N-acetyltransferase [Candidatus Hydrogenedentes bacterium]|nr:ribosomal protein S18-alanine N-acetyltransferase [Candidatus Hydrogenedentota bacterium]